MLNRRLIVYKIDVIEPWVLSINQGDSQSVSKYTECHGAQACLSERCCFLWEYID